MGSSSRMSSIGWWRKIEYGSVFVEFRKGCVFSLDVRLAEKCFCAAVRECKNKKEEIVVRLLLEDICEKLDYVLKQINILV